MPPSPKQMSFLEELVTDVIGAGVFAAKKSEFEALDKPGASHVITTLLQARKSANVGQSSRIPASRLRNPDPPVGFHYIDKTVYRVRISSTGNTYATRLVPTLLSNGSWEYVGKKPWNRLNEHTLMTLEQAQEFGKQFGICVRCAALLSDPQSVADGIGPVCKKRWGMV